VAGQNGYSHQHRYAAKDDHHFRINLVARASSSRITVAVGLALLGLLVRHTLMS
jgi:hypothetical protein